MLLKEATNQISTIRFYRLSRRIAGEWVEIRLSKHTIASMDQECLLLI